MSERLIEKIWTLAPEQITKERAWINGQIEEIGEQKLIDLAKASAAVREKAYQPYSHYSVGAALLRIDDKVYTCFNDENVVFEAEHAERGAIIEAKRDGAYQDLGRKFIKAIAISHLGGSGPCGGCGQRILEHTDNCLVLVADEAGIIQKITSIQCLMPDNFNPSHLGL